MNSVRHRANRNLVLRPSRKKGPEDLPAHLAVQLAHAIYLTAAVDRKIGHVERFRGIFLVLPSHGK